MHTAYGNEIDPAIIPCWIKRLNSSRLPADHRHNPVLALLITYYERLELFTTMPQSVDGLYDITDFRYVNTSNTDYHIGFEYSVYIFDQSMDRTVAICGIRYYAEGTNKQCLATTFTLIRYNSSIVTTTEPPNITTTDSKITEYTSTEITTVSDAITTTEGCDQTPNDTAPLPPQTATSGPLGSIVTGLSLSTLILVVMVAILVLITVILWVKLRIVSADVRVQRATCTCAQNLHQSSIQMNKEIVSDSEGENNENRSSNPN